jgi:2-dehydropantoate 2-reductase
MRIAIVGSGAVGGYYGASLARAGHRVTFMARGAHLRAIRERGLLVWSPLGDFSVRAPAQDNPALVGPVDLAILAVKTYDTESVLPHLAAFCAQGSGTLVLTLQNGVDSADHVAAIVGRERVLAGAAYIATAVTSPGVIEQTGTHRRIVFGEVFASLPSSTGAHPSCRPDVVGASRLNPEAEVSARVQELAKVLTGADIQAEPVADARVSLWEKFIYLAAYAAFSGAARQPAGAIWGDPIVRERFLSAVDEVHAVARAEGVPVAADMRERITAYMESVPKTMRASLLIDLAQGKRIEVEALQGAVVRRGAARGVPTPIMSTLYAVLKAAAAGIPS